MHKFLYYFICVNFYCKQRQGPQLLDLTFYERKKQKCYKRNKKWNRIKV